MAQGEGFSWLQNAFGSRVDRGGRGSEFVHWRGVGVSMMHACMHHDAAMDEKGGGFMIRVKWCVWEGQAIHIETSPATSQILGMGKELY